MTKNAVRNYFVSFKFGNIKNKYNKSWGSVVNLLWVIYFFLAMPAFVGFFDNKDYAITYFCIVTPVFFWIFASAIHPIKLPKIMFICPMKEQERRDYIVKSWIFHVIISMVIGVIGVTILMILGLCDGICFAGLMLNVVISSHSVNGLFYEHNQDKNSVEYLAVTEMYKMKGVIENDGAQTALIILMWLLAYCYGAILCWDTPVLRGVKWGFLIIEIIIEVPLFVKIMKKWTACVNRAVSYEGSYL